MTILLEPLRFLASKRQLDGFELLLRFLRGFEVPGRAYFVHGSWRSMINGLACSLPTVKTVSLRPTPPWHYFLLSPLLCHRPAWKNASVSCVPRPLLPRLRLSCVSSCLNFKLPSTIIYAT